MTFCQQFSLFSSFLAAFTYVLAFVPCIFFVTGRADEQNRHFADSSRSSVDKHDVYAQGWQRHGERAGSSWRVWGSISGSHIGQDFIDPEGPTCSHDPAKETLKWAHRLQPDPTRRLDSQCSTEARSAPASFATAARDCDAVDQDVFSSTIV